MRSSVRPSIYSVRLKLRHLSLCLFFSSVVSIRPIDRIFFLDMSARVFVLDEAERERQEKNSIRTMLLRMCPFGAMPASNFSHLTAVSID